MCVFSVDLEYTPPMLYFNSPSKTWDGTLIAQTFQPSLIVFLRDAKQSSNQSPPAAIQLVVKNLVSPVVMIAPNRTFHVVPFGDHSRTDRVSIQGFDIIDPDYGLSPIVVEIRATNGGKVSLNPLHVTQVQFNSQSFCRIGVRDSRWQCSGTGDSDQFMRFVGSVTAVKQALNGMVYRNIGAMSRETVFVRVFRGSYKSSDASSSSCLDEGSVTEFDRTSIYDGCYATEAQAEVVVSDYTWDFSDSPVESILTNLKYSLAIGVLVVAVAQLYKCFGKLTSITRSRMSKQQSMEAAQAESKHHDRDEESTITEESLEHKMGPLQMVGLNPLVWKIYKADDGAIYFMNGQTGMRSCHIYPVLET